jgi:hypothetical protein
MPRLIEDLSPEVSSRGLPRRPPEPAGKDGAGFRLDLETRIEIFDYRLVANKMSGGIASDVKSVVWSHVDSDTATVMKFWFAGNSLR